MLDDRSYMRDSEFNSRWSATTWLLAALTGVFVLQAIAESYRLFPVRDYLYLSLQGMKQGYLWQLLTFQFLHGGFFHLICNALVIYFFGRDLEASLGARRYLTLYFASGIAGGVLQMAFAAMVPRYFDGPVVGASAGAFGLVAALGTLAPHRTLTLLVLLVVPVNVRAITLLWISLGLALFGLLVPFGRFTPGGSIAHAAHLGGILAGIGYSLLISRDSGWSMNWFHLPRRRQSSPELVQAGAGRDAKLRAAKASSATDTGGEDFISREVDPILDKISAHGIQSLTERERRILEAARARMAKR